MWEQPVIEHGVTTRWGWRVDHPQHFVLGKNTDIGFGTYINAKQGVEIQDNVQIGSHCSIYSIDTEDGVQGEVILKKGAMIGSGCRIYPNVIIGGNAKIDANCVIKYGVKIGDNAKVGVLSYVKWDIPDNEFWYGIPAIFQSRRRIKGFRKEL